MISIKRSMDRLTQAEEAAQRDAAHRLAHLDLLLALEQAAGGLAGEAAGPFQRRLDQLRRDLAFDLAPPGVEQKASEARRELEGFASERAREREHRAWECQQIVRMAAEAASAMAQSGASHGGKLAQFAERMDSIAALDDLGAVRQALADRVAEIKTLATQVQAESRARASAIAAKLERAEARMAEAEKDATTDPLTGLGNRRQAEHDMRAAIDSGRRFSLLVCDLDQFKSINDLHGHATGDQALLAAARALRQTVRPGDTVCRWGGDEFLILVWDAPLAAAQKLAASLQAQPLVRIPVVIEGSERWIPVAASVGAAEHRDPEPADELFQRADRLMYASKSARSAAPDDAPRLGAFVAHNRTGGPMTIELDGRRYAVGGDTFTLPLPAGRYTAVIRARERKSFVAFQITEGATYTGDWS